MVETEKKTGGSKENRLHWWVKLLLANQSQSG
jgi:hypothetical protein